MADLFPYDLGGGLVLCAVSAADADEAYAIVDAERDRLREWLPWVDSTTAVETSRAHLAGLDAAFVGGAGIFTAIRLDGRLAGFADLRCDPLRASGEVGYWLSEKAVGRYVMTRTVAALIDIAFGPLDVHRVQLQAATGNARSRAVAERLGMTFEGVRREAEELSTGFVDLAVYSVLAQEWPGAAAALADASTGPTEGR
ncbi:MAG TPA: GNAT family protein [Mycobacteriales bacterium]|nr:GNAT family protein [Mycobacteriales bacterium]